MRHRQLPPQLGRGYDSCGARAGIAPEVHLASLKVLDARGARHFSDAIAALDRAVLETMTRPGNTEGRS